MLTIFFRKEALSLRQWLAHRPSTHLRSLTSGPGRLAQAFGITRPRDNGRDLTSPSSTLWIGEDSFRPGKIKITPRIGIRKAADHPLRYILADNPFVSGTKHRKI